MKNKIFSSVDEAVADVPDGASIMFAGFGGAGCANNLIRALARRGVRNLTVISNNCGTGEGETGILFKNGQVSRVIASFPGPRSNYFQDLYSSGKVELELNPQGTLSERLRAGGAGVPAFYTPTGYGTMVAEGKETREFDGRMYVMERGLRGDFAFIKAWKGDRWGNLIYRKTARNFNPMMATAADYVIAEVEELVDIGQLPPDRVHTPGIFVDAVFQGPKYEKRIERRTTRKI